MMKEIRVFYYSIILLASVGKNAASIQGRLLFKGGFYSRAASIFCFYEIHAASNQRRLLLKGGFYSRKYGSYYIGL